jgi:hypothetical protein
MKMKLKGVLVEMKCGCRTTKKTLYADEQDYLEVPSLICLNCGDEVVCERPMPKKKKVPEVGGGKKKERRQQQNKR